jgi:hypothetical protein
MQMGERGDTLFCKYFQTYMTMEQNTFSGKISEITISEDALERNLPQFPFRNEPLGQSVHLPSGTQSRSQIPSTKDQTNPNKIVTRFYLTRRYRSHGERLKDREAESSKLKAKSSPEHTKAPHFRLRKDPNF